MVQQQLKVEWGSRYIAAFSLPATTTWAHESSGTTHGRSSLSLNGRERLSVTGHSSFSLNSRATVLRPQGGMWWRGAGFSKCDPFHARSKCDLDHARPPPRTFRCDVAKMAWSYCAILAHCYCDRLHRDLPWPAAEVWYCIILRPQKMLGLGPDRQ